MTLLLLPVVERGFSYANSLSETGHTEDQHLQIGSAASANEKAIGLSNKQISDEGILLLNAKGLASAITCDRLPTLWCLNLFAQQCSLKQYCQCDLALWMTTYK